MADEEKPAGAFVPLKSITHGAPDAAAALAEIRQIYFKTSRQTIEHDFAHAIELLKSLPDEETRAKAHVFMEGIAEMRNEWMKPGKVKSAKVKVESKSKVRGTPKVESKFKVGSKPKPPTSE